MDNGSTDSVGSASMPDSNLVTRVSNDVLGICFTELIQMAVAWVRTMEPYLGGEENFGGNCGGACSAVSERPRDRSSDFSELTKRERARDGDILPECHGVAFNKARLTLERDREMGNSLNAGIDSNDFVRPELTGLASMVIASHDSAENLVFRGLLVRQLHAGFLHNVVEVLHWG
eukprot:6491500-Amphidinium_carterae.3